MIDLPGFVDHHAHFVTHAACYQWPDPQYWFAALAEKSSSPMDEPWPGRCDIAELEPRIRVAMQNAAALGLTHIVEAGIPDLSTYDALRVIRNDDDLPIGVSVLVASGLAEKLGVSELQRLRTGDEFLDVVGVKFYSDGWLSLRSCCTEQPFVDTGTTGIAFLDAETLARRATPFAEAGLQLATHAIGDKAIAAALDAYDLVFGGDMSACRLAAPRIEHAEMVGDETIARIAEMGVVVCFQPSFASMHSHDVIDALGRERARSTYDWTALATAGVRLIAGSDAPMASASPLVGLQRLVDDSAPHGASFPGSFLPLERALETMTDGSIGRTWLHSDPRSLSPAEIGAIGLFPFQRGGPVQGSSDHDGVQHSPIRLPGVEQRAYSIVLKVAESKADSLDPLDQIVYRLGGSIADLGSMPFKDLGEPSLDRCSE